MNPRKHILIFLLIILSFLAGRAVGWYEAHKFMEALADVLRHMAPLPCG